MQSTIPVFSSMPHQDSEARHTHLGICNSDGGVVMPSDITRQILKHCDAPALRSLAQTNRKWHRFLTHWEEFKPENYKDFQTKLDQAAFPQLRALDIAEKIIRYAPRLGVRGWLLSADTRYEMPPMKTSLTILSNRTDIPLRGAGQQILGVEDSKVSRTPAPATGESFNQSVDAAVSFVHDCTRKGRAVYLFEDMLNVISDMPDRQKAHAFIALVKSLPRIQRQFEAAGDDSNWLVDLQFAAPHLLPRRWSMIIDYSEIDRRFVICEKTGFPPNPDFIAAVHEIFPYLGRARVDFSISLFRLLRGFYIFSPIPSCTSYLDKFPGDMRYFFVQILRAAVRRGLLKKSDQKKCWKVLREIGFYNKKYSSSGRVKLFAGLNV